MSDVSGEAYVPLAAWCISCLSRWESLLLVALLLGCSLARSLAYAVGVLVGLLAFKRAACSWLHSFLGLWDCRVDGLVGLAGLVVLVELVRLAGDCWLHALLARRLADMGSLAEWSEEFKGKQWRVGDRQTIVTIQAGKD